MRMTSYGKRFGRCMKPLTEKGTGVQQNWVRRKTPPHGVPHRPCRIAGCWGSVPDSDRILVTGCWWYAGNRHAAERLCGTAQRHGAPQRLCCGLVS